MSDLAESDIEAHMGEHQNAVMKARNWFKSNMTDISVHSASSVLAEYEDFQKWYYRRPLDKGFSNLDIQNYPTSEPLYEMSIWCSSYRDIAN